MKIISICNQKGGVGKTTTTMNLAAALVKSGMRVLCVDLDPQGNLSEYLGHQDSDSTTISELMREIAGGNSIDPVIAIQKSVEGIYYIPSNIRLSSVELRLAEVMFREYILKNILAAPALQIFDYILIDCLPGLGLLLTNALIASDKILIPVQAQKFALSGLEDLLKVYRTVKQANAKLEIEGVLLTMNDGTVIARTVEEELRKRFNDLVFTTTISKLVEAVESTYNQRSLINTHGSRIGAQYTSVVSELLARDNVLAVSNGGQYA